MPSAVLGRSEDARADLAFRVADDELLRGREKASA